MQHKKTLLMQQHSDVPTPPTLERESSLEYDSDEESKGLPDTVLNEVKLKILKKDEYVLEHTETRNVIMVGRTRSGKSTAVGVLKNPCFQPEQMSIFSKTRGASLQVTAIFVVILFILVINDC